MPLHSISQTSQQCQGLLTKFGRWGQVSKRMKLIENQWQVEQRSYKHLKKKSCDDLQKRDLVLVLLQENFQLEFTSSWSMKSISHLTQAGRKSNYIFRFCTNVGEFWRTVELKYPERVIRLISVGCPVLKISSHLNSTCVIAVFNFPWIPGSLLHGCTVLSKRNVSQIILL